MLVVMECGVETTSQRKRMGLNGFLYVLSFKDLTDLMTVWRSSKLL